MFEILFEFTVPTKQPPMILIPTNISIFKKINTESA